jgi:hypothetical protein
MFYSYKPIQNKTEYFLYCKKRFIRLMPAYFLFSLIVFTGKIISQKFVHVDNPVKSNTELFKIFLYPMESFSVFLWYIYVLFLYYISIPVLLRIFNNNFKLLIAFSFFMSISLYFFRLPGLFALSEYCEYLFVFILGGLCAAKNNLFLSLIKKFGLFFLLIFITLISVIPFYDLPKLLVGLASIPALIYLVICIPDYGILQFFGDYTFSIYLMNTIFIGLIKAIILKFVSWDYSNFYFIAPVLLLSGIFIPLFIKRFLLPYIPFLNRIII